MGSVSQQSQLAMKEVSVHKNLFNIQSLTARVC